MFRHESSLFIFLFVFIIIVSACGGDNNLRFTNDFSDVPDLADFNSADTSWVTDRGVTVHVIEPGNPEGLQVGIRDIISAKFTNRNANVDNYGTNEDAILQSTYANGLTGASTISSLGSQSVIFYVSSTLIDGIIDMHEGEHRVLFFPDSLTSLGQPIVIDFELESIAY